MTLTNARSLAGNRMRLYYRPGREACIQASDTAERGRAHRSRSPWPERGRGQRPDATSSTPVPPAAPVPGPPPQLTRFDLNGYVLDTSYTGRNTENTFQQTYGRSMVQGVHKGPAGRHEIPAGRLCGYPIGHHELYVTWLDPSLRVLDASSWTRAPHRIRLRRAATIRKAQASVTVVPPRA